MLSPKQIAIIFAIFIFFFALGTNNLNVNAAPWGSWQAITAEKPTGTFTVGAQIAPGQWQNQANSTCTIKKYNPQWQVSSQEAIGGLQSFTIVNNDFAIQFLGGCIWKFVNSGQSNWNPTPTPNSSPPAPENNLNYGQVTRVIDGDTIVVRVNGQDYTIRYLGINTPETNEVCGHVATEVNRHLVHWKWVRLESDKRDKDRYDRLLRYVYVGGQNINATLVQQGWAEAKDYGDSSRLQAWFNNLHQEAERANRGCHAQNAFGEYIEPTSTAPPNNHSCDPSYPTICIPPSPPDLNCNDIPHKNFTVLQPDPHDFDSNKNGIGCES